MLLSASGRPEKTVEAHKAAILTSRVSRDGSSIVTGTYVHNYSFIVNKKCFNCRKIIFLNLDFVFKCVPIINEIGCMIIL
jgi:hypothetical protein